jgi:CO dehydrogenase/acetyl-CoA synthase beta subunit
MRTKREEARLLSYTLLYDKTGKLITERVSTDIEKLKKFLTVEDYNLLKTTIRETTIELDKIHNKIEAHLNGRIFND